MGLALGCLQVEQSTIAIRASSIKTIAIREVFGKYEDVLVPGCHYVPLCMGRPNSWLPFFACATTRFSLRNQDKVLLFKTKLHN
jgi:hypothetical protein